MHKRRQIWLVAICVTLLTVIASFLVQPAPDPLFRGRPESDWISGVRYYDELQVKQWREFGPDGVQVLTRGLGKILRAKEYRYRVLYRQVPFQLRRLLSTPKMDVTRGKRMEIISLLVQLNSDLPEAESVMVKELEDLDAAVRGIAITYFTHSEDENAVLAKMAPARRKELLPLFLVAVRDPYVGLRNNGIIALWYYPEEPQAAAAIVRLAFEDSDLKIRELAGKSLKRMKPQAIVAGGGITTAMLALQNPDETVARLAASFLGEIHAEPAKTIPALLKSVADPRDVVAEEALKSLGQFPEQARATVTALETMLQNPQVRHREAINHVIDQLRPRPHADTDKGKP